MSQEHKGGKIQERQNLRGMYMKYYDVSQEVFSSNVYPGDPVPEFRRIQSIRNGNDCNLTYLKMCAHNGTHMDAPKHFMDNGRAIDELRPEEFMGMCQVFEYTGTLGAEMAYRITAELQENKILLKGDLIISEEAAGVFAKSNVKLLGVEGQTVGSEDITQKVHKILLGADMVIVEGLRLSDVAPGKYFLAALPLNLAGSDGSPCRVVLVQ